MKLKTVYRVTTFVPPEHLEALLKGITSVVPLAYGRYDHVALWSAPGIEQFRPQEGSNPTLGQTDTVERGTSIKLEFAIPRDDELLHRLLTDGIIKSHPWEEPVIYVDECQTTRVQVDEADLATAK